MVVHPLLKSASKTGREDALLGEAVGLAKAINLNVVHSEIVTLGRRRPATLFGSGVVKRLSSLISANGEGEEKDRGGPKGKAMNGGKITVVIVDAPLSPVQQRNLERD